MYCLIREPGKARELDELGARIIIGDVTNKTSMYQGMKDCDFSMASWQLWLIIFFRKRHFGGCLFVENETGDKMFKKSQF
ncbi:MAG: hypothetical protein A4E56_03210 [Pelotomaculum sp. PtaU1.Bin065]|nr:MAG: hypothetical protein A4E56_03210 [Pelotomaculum sp. PtaU1.Bin065]